MGQYMEAEEEEGKDGEECYPDIHIQDHFQGMGGMGMGRGRGVVRGSNPFLHPYTSHSSLLTLLPLLAFTTVT